jgi:hypothetical protein
MGWIPPRRCGAKYEAQLFIGVGISIINLREEPEMNASTVAVDLAKSLFRLAVADEQRRVVETHRLTRAQLVHCHGSPEILQTAHCPQLDKCAGLAVNLPLVMIGTARTQIP